MKVLAIDPGGTTGFAFYSDEVLSSDRAANRGVYGTDAWATPADDVGRLIHDYVCGDHNRKPDVIVCESFHITSQTYKKTQAGALTAIELIGVARYLADAYHVRFVLQRPTEAKTFATDAKLRKMGWWTKGTDHARDATRHLLLFLASEKLLDLTPLVGC